MKVVIEINDNEYMGIKEYPNNITSYPVTIHLYDAVRNGTPLSEGDLISRADAIDACDQSINLFEAVDRIKEL